LSPIDVDVPMKCGVWVVPLHASVAGHPPPRIRRRPLLGHGLAQRLRMMAKIITSIPGYN
jgi:hypothetical protein